MSFFPAKFVDDKQIDTFTDSTLDPCVDTRESIWIEATTPRLVTPVQRDLDFATAQQVGHEHIAATSTRAVGV
jgi:hypothetical protein